MLSPITYTVRPEVAADVGASATSLSLKTDATFEMGTFDDGMYS